MFYGGTLYAVAGALSVLAGHRPGVAFEATIVLSVAASYGGVLWLARQLGVRSWMAHAPALTFAASAYYVTNLYGRGAWSEFVATSALPLLVASGVRIARSPRLEAVPCALFVASAIVASGSHNITLLWGSITFAVALVALRVALRRPLTVERRRIAWLVALLGLALCANAWFLLPAVTYARDTQISSNPILPWRASGEFNHPRRVLFPDRHGSVSRNTPALYVEAPVWMLGWALGALALLWRRVTPALRRAAFVFVMVLAALLALILVESLYDALPRVLAQIQYPYRLNTYVALAIAGARAHRGHRHRERRRACPTATGARARGRDVDHHRDLRVAAVRPGDGSSRRPGCVVSPNRAPATWYNGVAYLDTSARVVAYPPHRLLRIDPSGLRGNRATLTLTPPAGRQPFAMTMGAGPEIVNCGLERLGRRRRASPSPAVPTVAAVRSA